MCITSCITLFFRVFAILIVDNFPLFFLLFGIFFLPAVFICASCIDCIFRQHLSIFFSSCMSDACILHYLKTFSTKADCFVKKRNSASALFLYVFSILKNSSYTDWTTVIHVGIFNTAGRCTCMHDRSVSYIYTNMSAIANNVSRLCVSKAHLISTASHCTGRMRKSDSKRSINTHYKSRTICSVCKTGSSCHVRVANKLTCIIDNCLSIRTARCIVRCASST